MHIPSSVFLVTGGASGLGEAVVRALVSQGARCLIADMNEQVGNGLCSSLPQTIFHKTDVSEESSVKAAIGKCIAQYGQLNGVVHCAGIALAKKTLGRDGSVHPLGDFEKILKINLSGSFNIVRLAVEVMARQKPNEDGERGVIVMTASVAAFDGQIGQAAYAASKAGVVGMTLPLARELASLGIRVATVAPGLFSTPMMASLPAKAQEALGKSVPFPSRLGKPEEYAALVKSIIENPYINGETIRIDGSLRMAPM
eukprot:ANDGO_02432.mRNA.1 hypothetical protein